MSSPNDEQDIQVRINGIRLGAAPVTLPSAQVSTLLGSGELLANDNNESGPAAGITFQPNGSVLVSRGGDYHIFGIAEDRQVVSAAADKRTIRTAQFVCGITGLVLINLILLYDVAGRGSNVKDFLINFASDISALGAVLIIAELVDKRMGGGGLVGALHPQPAARTTTGGTGSGRRRREERTSTPVAEELRPLAARTDGDERSEAEEHTAAVEVSSGTGGSAPNPKALSMLGAKVSVRRQTQQQAAAMGAEPSLFAQPITSTNF